jgi:ribonuclease HI
VLIDRHNDVRKVFSGAMNCGTISIAESMPYVHALLWYVEHGGKQTRKRLARQINVHIVTDSQFLVNTGNKLKNRTKMMTDIEKNVAVWAALVSFEKLGFKIHWHWKPRESTALNVYCDLVSRNNRLQIAELSEPNVDGEQINVNDLNP